MQPPTIIRSPGAIALGACCAIGTLTTLFWHVRSTSDLTVNHILILLALVCALGSGHFAWKALRQWYVFSAAGFFVLFVAGTAVCAVISAGRGAEALARNRADVSHADGMRLNHEQKIAEARTDKDALKAELQKAEASAQGKIEAASFECKSGVGGRCKGATQAAELAKTQVADLIKRSEGADARFWQLVAELDYFKPQTPPNPELRHAAKVYALISGVDETRANEALELLWPGLLSFLSELGTIVFLHYGVSGRSPATVAARVSAPYPVRHAWKLFRAHKPTDEEIVLGALHRAGRPLSNDELAIACGVSKGESSKRVAACAARGVIHVMRHGRYLSIKPTSLPH